jgi:hypothetical protein
MEEVVWGCFAGNTVIYLEFKAHLTSMTTTGGLRLVGLSFIFQQDNDPTHHQAL